MMHTTETPTVPTTTPPPWFNRMMEGLLHTPGVQSWVGNAIALITFTGRRTGKTYTTPVSYYRDGDAVIVITKRFRKWWRNLRDKPEVELRIKGRTLRGRAELSTGEDKDLAAFLKFLEHRPFDAKAYGLTPSDGRVDRDKARAVLAQLVLIRIPVSGTAT
jgi:deazaflavin-dependent oxidoreductase (nitroreductase family)